MILYIHLSETIDVEGGSWHASGTIRNRGREKLKVKLRISDTLRILKTGLKLHIEVLTDEICDCYVDEQEITSHSLNGHHA